MKRFENSSLMRIEILLEKLLAHFEKENDQSMVNDITKNLKKIKKDNEEMHGGDFL